MPSVTQSLDIPASPDQVWAVAGDLGRYGEWNVTHTSFPDGPPSTQEGATFKEQITIMGMPGEASWTVTEANAPTLMRWQGEGPMGIKLGTRLELAGDGERESTMVTIEISFESALLAGPIGEAVTKSAQQGALDSLERLRGLVV
ncbi:MAG: type II toxin-antitoxin system Rv0910 family toxin [Solirubrobacteraceae bacterium]